MNPTSCWTPAQLADLNPSHDCAPPISLGDIWRVSDSVDIWDAWPIQQLDGSIWLHHDDAQIWMALGAPHHADPERRHAHARIMLLRRAANGDWALLGPAMPDEFSPGSREWSGSAIIDQVDNTVTLYFTAAGRRGEIELSFEQRLFSARAALGEDGRCRGWHDLQEIVSADPAHYMSTTVGGGIGTIKAFRDPAWFHDPVSGEALILFAGSKAGSASAFNGVVGMARAGERGRWTLHPPILVADGLNNELERPHLLHRDGSYYLFWSTQAHVFDPAGPIGPTGLYGMVSQQLDAGWKPLNGSGLIFANPADAPAQAYSWLVLPDLSVTSFVDDWGGGAERRFGATFAPFLHIWVDGDRAGLR